MWSRSGRLFWARKICRISGFRKAVQGFASGHADHELGEKKTVSALLLLLFGALFSVSKIGWSSEHSCTSAFESLRGLRKRNHPDSLYRNHNDDVRRWSASPKTQQFLCSWWLLSQRLSWWFLASQWRPVSCENSVPLVSLSSPYDCDGTRRQIFYMWPRP